jgi:ABC-type Fe3+ transport system substrate-binding protein
MHPLFRLVSRLLPAVLVALVSIACSKPAPEPEVVVISPHWEGIKDETSRAFSAWHQKTYGQPATIRWRELGGGGPQIIKFLRGEYAGHASSGLDVLYGGGIDPFRDLKKDGLLARCDLPPEILAAIPAQLNGMDLRDPDQEWFGASLADFGIITNERARGVLGLPPVRQWSDLIDPRLDGWISACDPRASSSALSIYEIILQSLGWERGWAVLMQMSGNTRAFLSSSAASAVEVGVGDATFGVAIDSYGQAQSAYYGPQNVSFVLPQGQTVITPDSIAVLKNPPHPEMARRFLQFVLGRPGQLLWMVPRGQPGGAVHAVINRMSVQPALYDELAGVTPVRTDPFRLPNDLQYSEELGAKRRVILGQIIAACMIDPHDGLVRAWRALNDPANASRRNVLLAKFVTPPCTAQELLSDSALHDPVQRTALLNRWQNEALRRYAEIAREAAHP